MAKTLDMYSKTMILSMTQVSLSLYVQMTFFQVCLTLGFILYNFIIDKCYILQY